MTTRSLFRNIGCALAIFAVTANVQGGVTDLATSPPIPNNSVLPNVMYVLDDSGSMAWDYMPDTTNNFVGKYGYTSSQCNGVYYNPTMTYTPPVNSAGTSYAASSFTAAPVDGVGTTTAATIDLSTNFLPGQYTNSSPTTSGGVPAYYYTYSGTQTTAKKKNYYNTASTFYTECNTSTASGSGVFAKVTVSSTSGAGGTDERTNFANWYSYYRTRILMMKTASGLAFSPMSSNLRVAFMTINNNVSPDILNWATFDPTQKGLWYTKLYGATPANSTPLRAALSNVGMMYANKLTSLYSTTIADPIQYSCQKNFTVLSTDGFWNGTAGTQVDGTTAVGNQDGAEPRPYFDGNSTLYTMTTSQTQQSQTQVQQSTSQVMQSTSQITQSTSQITQSTSQVTKSTSQITQSTSQVTQSTSQITKSTSQITKSTSQVQAQTAPLQSRSCSTSMMGVTTCGSWSTVTSCTWSGGGGAMMGGATGMHGGTAIQCQYTSYSSWTNASSCSALAAGTSTSDGSTWNGPATNCQTVLSGPTAASSCSAGTVSGLTTTCGTTTTGPTAVSSCSAGTVSGLTTTCGTTTTGPTAVSSCSAGTVSGLTTTCGTTTTGPTAVSSCTAGTVSGLTTTCGTTTTGPTAVSSCSAGTVSGLTTTCGTTTTGPTAVSSCSAGTVSGLTTTCSTTTTGPTPVASCTAGTASGLTTTCNTITVMAPTFVSSCTPVSASSGNSYTATVCTPVTAATSVGVCTASSPTSANNYTTTTCSAGTTTPGTYDTLADVADYYYNTDLRTAALGNSTSNATGFVGTDVATNNVIARTTEDKGNWQHMSTFTVGLGTRGSMAYDNASYWGDTSSDFNAVLLGSTANAASGICSWLADGTVCNWPTPVSNTYTAVDDLWHAAVDGRGTFFSAVDTGKLYSGLSSALDSMASNSGMWAAPTVSNPMLSATDNFLFVTGFNTYTWVGELKREQIDPTTGGIKSSGGVLIDDWTAQAQLDTNASRTIYTYSSSAANHLKTFTWANLSSSGTVASCASGAGEQGCFAKSYISSPTPLTGVTGLTQFLCASSIICLSSANQTTASGANLVSYLAGVRTNEGSQVDNSAYYRQRAHLLGDLVNASTAYVKGSLPSYTDSGYGAFSATNSSRQGMVYAAANDGMLHAFNADTGAEAWAYIPSMLLPKLYTLADKNYANKHQYFVDATPVSGDVYFGGAWHTILVGGLGGGGKGYYALDVTNPAAPKALWEFSTATDANVGYTYGNPIVTKLSDGTWVVLATSGYNNADGVGRLYVINAGTGALIRTISTGVGSAGTPSGLAHISAMVPNGWSDNTVQQVYGGDMLGNLWRFDVNGTTVGATGYDAQLLVSLKGSTGTAQPITTSPVIGNINGTVAVYVGTGSFLGNSDMTTTDQSTTGKQSMYAIKDALATGTVSATAIYATNPRLDTTNFIAQPVTNGTCATTIAGVCTAGDAIRTSANNAVSFTSNSGWYVDFPDTGERANTDPQLMLGALQFVTNVPSSTGCSTGSSYRWFLDYKTGAAITNSSVTSNTVVSIKNTNGMSTGVGNFYLSHGATGSALSNNNSSAVSLSSGGVSATTVCDLAGNCFNSSLLTPDPSPPGPSRTSWRELITE